MTSLNSELPGEDLQWGPHAFGMAIVVLQGKQCALVGAGWELALAQQGIADCCPYGRNDNLL